MKTTFNDIAGYKDEKDSILTIVKLFKNYEHLKKIGVKLPKGLLLYGNPGVGKTLFTKAIANELNREFIVLDFLGKDEESFTQLITNVFEKAKENTPSIIFIDEIDKLVPIIKPMGQNYISDYSRTNLTILLQLLDGFEANGDIMVIATTNSLGEIPSALTRSGRIDKHIYIPHPDDKSRLDIINYYLNKVDFNYDLDINQINLSSEGLSGADISTIINQAFIEAITNNREVLTTKDVLKQIQMVQGRNIIKTLDGEDSKIVSIHELGHFVVAKHFNKSIKDISISKMNHSLGRVRLRSEGPVYAVSEVETEVKILLAGRAAEEIILGNVYLGSRDDVYKAYCLVEDSVNYGEYGFEYLNVTRNGQRTEEFIGKTKEKINEIINKCYKETLKIVEDNREVINKLYPELVEKNLLTVPEITKYLNDLS